MIFICAVIIVFTSLGTFAIGAFTFDYGNTAVTHLVPNTYGPRTFGPRTFGPPQLVPN